MSNIIKIKDIEGLILNVQGQRMLLDSDITRTYGGVTRDINKTISNKPGRFPSGYLVEQTKQEKHESEESFHRFERLKHATTTPKAFTDKGLYMRATILKSQVTTQTILGIIETFSRLRELSRNVKELTTLQENSWQKMFMPRSGKLMAEILDDDLQTSDAETAIGLNFEVLKFKHAVKKRKGDKH